MESIAVAIINKTNELAERWGVAPYDFYAQFEYDHDLMLKTLTLTPDPSTNVETRQRLSQMATALGMLDQLQVSTTNKWQLTGDNETVYKALDAALAVAPKRSGRSR